MNLMGVAGCERIHEYSDNSWRGIPLAVQCVYYGADIAHQICWLRLDIEMLAVGLDVDMFNLFSHSAL